MKITPYLFYTLLGGCCLLSACATRKNTATTRWWKAFNTRYNVYYNGQTAYIEGSLEKEKGNKDNYLQLLPLYTVGNKPTQGIGKMQMERAIEKSKKAIQLHSIKKRPAWEKQRRKTAEDIEWLNRKEYNPFLWKVWLLMGKAQFHSGNFDEASATFAYMSRLYQTQPAIYGKARAWLAKAYIENRNYYDAEVVIRDMERQGIVPQAQKEWNYALADYALHNENYAEAARLLPIVAKQEMRKVQKARIWYLAGQVYTRLGQTAEARKAYQRVLRLHPSYELALNARIAMTEVTARTETKSMLKKLQSMTKTDVNKPFANRLFYAIGNIYLTQKDTLHALKAYEEGRQSNKDNTPERGVLLTRLGDLYWQMQQFPQASLCYGEAIGLIDKNEMVYAQTEQRAKILEELVPQWQTVHQQDSLQQLAAMPESSRNAIIDKHIALLKKQDRENKSNNTLPTSVTSESHGQETVMLPKNMPMTTDNAWYFYNPTAVSQGKATFERTWGKRPNEDNWQRSNKTMLGTPQQSDTNAVADTVTQKITPTAPQAESSSPGDKPEYRREYYLEQLPLTPEKKQASDKLIAEALVKAAVIIKDRTEWTTLSRTMLLRRLHQYADIEGVDEALYHLYLLSSREGNRQEAAQYLLTLQQQHAKSQYTVLLSNPYFEENARNGVHIEDSLYTQTYQAYLEKRFEQVNKNVRLANQRFPEGANHDKFLFLSGMTQLQQNQTQSALTTLRELAQKYPESGVAKIAGSIVNGIEQGRTLRGTTLDMADIWQQRSQTIIPGDSTRQIQLSDERETPFLFVIAFAPDSVEQNKLLFALANYNFSNYLVRNFDIAVNTAGRLNQLVVSGFRNLSEVQLYAQQLQRQKAITTLWRKARILLITPENLALVGQSVSYNDYQAFYEQHLYTREHIDASLLAIPEEMPNTAPTVTPPGNTVPVIGKPVPNAQKPLNIPIIIDSKKETKKTKTFDVEDEYYDVEGF